MFPQFGATAESLSKASSLVFRIGSDAHLYDDPENVNIAPLLDSKFDSEKSEALKRLLALIAQGFDVSNFFPQVVKNVASPSIEMKKLVYLYLLHYAEKRPNEALLSINCFQKDLSDTNPIVRAWALRAMAGIHLHVIAPLVLVAVTKCARDPSPYVRKCAANALPKINDLHQEEHSSALEELVHFLLSDQSPGVVGAAAAAFNSVCPNNLSLIGRDFRRLCETLPDVEEWGQIVLVGILLRYVVARHGLVRESLLSATYARQITASEKESKDVSHDNKSGYTGNEVCDATLTASLLSFYIEGSSEYLLQSSYSRKDVTELDSVMFTSADNYDVKILLQCTCPLLWSRNSGVVLAAAGVHWLMSPKEDVKKIVKPLLFLLRSSPASKYVVLCNIQVFAKVMPSLFAPYSEDFYVCFSDSYQVKALKLDILSTIVTESSIQSIFQELQDYVKDPDQRFAADTVAVIGLCAQRLPQVANNCLEGLLALIQQESSFNRWDSTSGEAHVLAQAVMSIKTIIKENPASFEKVIVQLARNLDVVKVPAARATIVWIMGEYGTVGPIISNILPLVSKYLASCFPLEGLETKLQILNSIAKIVLHAHGESLSTFQMVLTYILELAKLDLNYDVRDRARVIRTLTSSQTPNIKDISTSFHQNVDLVQKVARLILSGKSKPVLDRPHNFRFYLPGSLSQLVLHAAPGYDPLPKPGSLPFDELDASSELASLPRRRSSNSDSSGMNDPDTLSGSSVEEIYSQNSGVDSESTRSGSYLSDDNDSGSPLIQLSDAAVDHVPKNGWPLDNNNTQFSPQLTELMPNRAFESWLDEQPSLSETSSRKQRDTKLSTARISIRDIDVRVKLKTHTLIDPSNGNGLSVNYSFSSETSDISSSLVCVEISFENCSTEPLTNIKVEDEESDLLPTSTDQTLETHISSGSSHDLLKMVPVEEIEFLGPGLTAKKILQVHFHHHLLPLKMFIFCNGRKYPIKLWPDIGYFMKPLSMDIDAFINLELRLPGMFEYTGSCTFGEHVKELSFEDHKSMNEDKFLLVCQSLVTNMLSHANLFLVSVEMPVSVKIDDASGLSLRFCGEILSSSVPCLVTIMVVEGKCTEPLKLLVKVNCKDTVFGLNLLNRIVGFLGCPSE
ncbi:AP3-complex subunit beta-A [Aristolochia californica]|uniref:AP3-complex subunit beta-A n=1 Tax=Aristolochia californica TaxID=171875 RepID=UPI0035D562A6